MINREHDHLAAQKLLHVDTFCKRLGHPEVNCRLNAHLLPPFSQCKLISKPCKYIVELWGYWLKMG